MNNMTVNFKRMNRFLIFPVILLLLSLAAPLLAQDDGYGLTGTYYINDNLSNAAVTEVDPWLSFLWNGCPPQPNMSVSIFSAQWTGFVEPSYSEPYTFTVFIAGGVSVIVDGQTLINQWTDSANTSYQGIITLSAGVTYPLVVDYFTDGANPTTDHIQLNWQSPSQAEETIPHQYLFTGNPLQPTPIPQSTMACQFSPTVNGVLSDWAWNANLPWNSVTKNVLGNTYGASAQFNTLWDTNNLYVGVTVTDSQLYSPSPSAPWQGSAVEVYIDTTHSRSITTNSTDYEYIFAWNSTTPSEINGRTTGVVMKTNTIATGYVLEASIPWTTLGLSPRSGTTLGFDLGVDVNHSGGGCRSGQLMWNGESDNYANASDYGNLTLETACPTPVATPPEPTQQPYVYANPTSGPSVTFVYNMAQPGTAKIRVWNAWGNLVATINDPKPAGEESSSLDVTSFAPGHYFYRVVLNYQSGQNDSFATQILAVKK